MPTILSDVLDGRPDGRATLTRPDSVAADTSERRYVLKWTDDSQGFCFPCEKRDLTWDDVAYHLRRTISIHRRRYLGYSKQNVRVCVQCPCGRDVLDITTPHTVPYERGVICHALH